MIFNKLLKKYIIIALSSLTLLPTLALYTEDDYISHKDYQPKLAQMDFALPEGVLIDPHWILTSADRANKLNGTVTLCKIANGSSQCSIEKKIAYDHIVYSKSNSPSNNFNTNLALIHLSEPITMITSAKRIRSVKPGDAGVYLCSYNQDTESSNIYTKVLGTSQACYCGPGIPYQLVYSCGRTIFEAKIDTENPNDNGSGLYIKDPHTHCSILAGIFEHHNKEQSPFFQATSISDFNKWIDNTILKFTLEVFDKTRETVPLQNPEQLIKSYEDFLNNLPSHIELTSEKLCGVAVDSKTVITQKTNITPTDIMVAGNSYNVLNRIVINDNNLQVLHLQKPIKDLKLIQKRLRVPLKYFSKGVIFNKSNQVFFVQDKSYLPDQYRKLQGAQLPAHLIKKLKLNINVTGGTGLYVKCPDNNSSLLAGLVIQRQAILFSPELNTKIDHAILKLTTMSHRPLIINRPLPTPSFTSKNTLRDKVFIDRPTENLYKQHLSDKYAKLTFKELLAKKKNAAFFITYFKDMLNKLDPHKAYTFFIPTNNAMTKLTSKVLEKLDEDENARHEFINCHIVKEKVILPPFETEPITTKSGASYKSIDLAITNFPELRFIYDINGKNAKELLIFSNQDKSTIKILNKGFIVGENIIYFVDTPIVSNQTLDLLINEGSLHIKRQNLLKKQHTKPLISKPTSATTNVQIKENYSKCLLGTLNSNADCKKFHDLISKSGLSNFLLRNPEEPILLIVPNNDILTQLETDLEIDLSKMSLDDLCYFIKHFIIPFPNKIESIKTDSKSNTLTFLTTNIKKISVTTIEEDVPIKKGSIFLTESGDQLYFNNASNYGLQLTRFNSEILTSYYSSIINKAFYKCLPLEVAHSYKNIEPPKFDQVISCLNGTMLILRNSYCIKGETGIISSFFTKHFKARFSLKYPYSSGINLVNDPINNPTILKPITKVKRTTKEIKYTILEHLEKDEFFRKNILSHKDLKTNYVLEDLLGNNATTNFVLLLPDNCPLPKISTNNVALNQLDLYNDLYYDFLTFDKTQILNFLKMHLLKFNDKIQEKLITGDYSSVFEEFLTPEGFQGARNIHLNLDDAKNQTVSYIDAYGDYRAFKITKIIKCKNGFVCITEGRILPYIECKNYFILKNNINNFIRICKKNLQHIENEELALHVIQGIKTKIASKELIKRLENKESINLELTRSIAKKNYEGENDDFITTLNNKIIEKYKLKKDISLDINIEQNHLEFKIQDADPKEDEEEENDDDGEINTSTFSSSSTNSLNKASTETFSGDYWKKHPMFNIDEKSENSDDDNSSSEWED